MEPERSNGIEKQAHTPSVKSGVEKKIVCVDYLISMSYFIKYNFRSLRILFLRIPALKLHINLGALCGFLCPIMNPPSYK